MFLSHRSIFLLSGMRARTCKGERRNVLPKSFLLQILHSLSLSLSCLRMSMRENSASCSLSRTTFPHSSLLLHFPISSLLLSPPSAATSPLRISYFTLTVSVIFRLSLSRCSREIFMTFLYLLSFTLSLFPSNSRSLALE